MTATEKLVWKELQTLRKEGVAHFRKQAPIGRYVADFADHSRRLIIELDGPHHDRSDRRDADAQRHAWLLSQGYRVLRFRNEAVWENLAEVMAQIRSAIPPTPDPSPTRGEGKEL